LRALRKRKPQETQALALASSQSWSPLLRPNIPIGWRLRLLRENFTQQTQEKIAAGSNSSLGPIPREEFLSCGSRQHYSMEVGACIKLYTII